MSKALLFGQQVNIFIEDGTKSKKRLGEINNFAYKLTDVVKKSSSLGETGVGTIDVLDDGGTLSFELSKSDATFGTFFSQIHKHLRGGDKAGRRGKAPYYVIIAEFTYMDESQEKMVFEGVVLHDNEGSVSGRTEVMSEKMQGTFKKFYVENDSAGEAGVSGAKGKAMFMTALLALADLSANTTKDFPETTDVKDYATGK
jgi:hypothetical protein